MYDGVHPETHLVNPFPKVLAAKKNVAVCDFNCLFTGPRSSGLGLGFTSGLGDAGDAVDHTD
jgi:hypothetical protein